MCICVCAHACTYASDVYSRVGAVHMDSHLLNASDDFFLMTGKAHSYSSEIPEKQHRKNKALIYANKYKTNTKQQNASDKKIPLLTKKVM